MAALLVGMSVAAVLITVAMPVWKQMTRREREAELVFRGQQYARAIGLFQKRAGPGVLPPSIDALVTGRFLRRKYIDPITGQDFDLLRPQQAPTVPGQASPQPAGSAAQGRGAAPSTGAVGTASTAFSTSGIMGVASKSTAASLLIYNGRTHYNEWQFIYVPQTQAPAGAGGAAGTGPAGGTPRGGAQSPSGNGGPFAPGGRGSGRGSSTSTTGDGAIPQRSPQNPG